MINNISSIGKKPYTLIFRITREVWDALETGRKPLEYRDSKPFWDKRMERAMLFIMSERPVEALFLSGRKKTRYAVTHVWEIRRGQVPERWRGYLTTPRVWAVELGEGIA